MDVVQHQILSLDFWQDTVSYEGKNFPSGTIGCDALNIPAALIKQVWPMQNCLRQPEKVLCKLSIN